MPRFGFFRYTIAHATNLSSCWRLYKLARLHRTLEKSDSAQVFEINDNGTKLQIGLRPGTTDIGNFHEVFFKRQYDVKLPHEPRVIFDIGGNIGLSAIWLATRYPNSRIHVFEPLSENFRALTDNIHRNGLANRITAHPYAIGAADGHIPLYKDPSNTLWGYSLYQPVDQRSGKPAEVAELVTVKRLSPILEQLGHPPIDLLKLDCEGAELDVLYDLGIHLSGVTTVVGEIHYSLCDGLEFLKHLSLTHKVQWDKSFASDCGSFLATRIPS